MNRNILRLSQQIRHALAAKKPIVALQSTIISHGMPYPDNLKCALSIQKTVRENGSVPATVSIMDGFLHVGLSQKMIQKLAFQGTKVKKISRRDLPYIITSNKIGATTVSATMIAAKMAGIDIFVTGGIGGVHRGYQQTMDVSADLRQLGRTRVTVVSAGVKSILDISKTLEYLQTQGVPVITYGSQYFPAFFSASSGIKSPYSFNDLNEIAKLIKSQEDLKLQNGILVTVPNPNPAQGETTQKAIQQALRQCKQQKIGGAQTTPFLLKRVNQLTKGKSLQSNISLVHNNAKIGSKLAQCLSKIKITQDNNKNIYININKEKQLQPKIIVIGGSAIDYQIKPASGLKFQLYKSCIGKSRKTLGGVGRNIAQCVGRLGINVDLVTCLSNDNDGQFIQKNCQKHKINLFSVKSDKPTGKYLAIMDNDNNQFLGISDMQINQLLTFQNVYNSYLSKNQIGQKDIAIIDANFDKKSLKQLILYLNDKKCFIIFQAKGQKSKKIIETGGHQYISMLKMNQLQRKQIIDNNKQLLKQIGNKSTHQHYKKFRALTTNGGKQIKVFTSNGQQLEISVPKVQKIVKTTGAGDTLTGTFSSMLLKCYSSQRALDIAIKASKKAVQSDISQSVIPDITFNELVN